MKNKGITLFLAFACIVLIVALCLLSMMLVTVTMELESAKATIAHKDVLIDELTEQRDLALRQLAETVTAETQTTPETVEESEEIAPQGAVVYAATDAASYQQVTSKLDDASAGLRSLGTFKVTHYDCCVLCCGNTSGITASGRQAVPDYTIAVDPSVIPLGSAVWLDYGDGQLVEYRADDTGGAVKGAVIDVCVGDHATALNLGRRSATVYVQEAMK